MNKEEINVFDITEIAKNYNFPQEIDGKKVIICISDKIYKKYIYCPTEDLIEEEQRIKDFLFGAYHGFKEIKNNYRLDLVIKNVSNEPVKVEVTFLSFLLEDKIVYIFCEQSEGDNYVD